MFWKKNGKYVAAVIVVLAVLAGAFWYGGNAPGLQGGAAEPPSVETAADAPQTKPSSAEEENRGPEQLPSAEKGTAAVSEAPENTPPEQPPAAPEKKEENKTPQKPDNPGKDREYAEKNGMKIDPNTGKDIYQTDPVPEGKPLPVEPEDVTVSDKAYTCTLSISCGTILSNMDWLQEEKTELVPEDGWILKPTEVTFYEGESVFNVLQRVCKQQRIHMEFRNTPMYHSAYIEGIHNLYEFDCGEQSGWMYKVNDWFPNYGCSRYQLQEGDEICWVYTCDLGHDVGNM